MATRTPLSSSSSTVSPCCSTAHASVPLTNRNVFRISRSLGLPPKKKRGNTWGRKGRHGHMAAGLKDVRQWAERKKNKEWRTAERGEAEGRADLNRT